MICCKIIFDSSNKNGSISKAFESLSKHGEFLWEDNYLYFADTEGDISEKKISNIIKRAGFTKVYVDEYTKDNPPQEKDNINGWLTDKLIRINYKKCELESQKAFRDISKGLDIIDAELAEIAKGAKNQNKKNGGLS